MLACGSEHANENKREANPANGLLTGYITGDAKNHAGGRKGDIPL